MQGHFQIYPIHPQNFYCCSETRSEFLLLRVQSNIYLALLIPEEKRSSVHLLSMWGILGSVFTQSHPYLWENPPEPSIFESTKRTKPIYCQNYQGGCAQHSPEPQLHPRTGVKFMIQNIYGPQIFDSLLNLVARIFPAHLMRNNYLRCYKKNIPATKSCGALIQRLPDSFPAAAAQWQGMGMGIPG